MYYLVLPSDGPSTKTKMNTMLLHSNLSNEIISVEIKSSESHRNEDVILVDVSWRVNVENTEMPSNGH